MNIAVLVAFVKEPREVVLITDRTTVALDAIPGVTWTLTALIPSSETAFQEVAEFAATRPRVGVALFPDEGTLWKEAIKTAPPDADIIVTLDGATDWPEEIPELLEPLRNSAVGAVIGVRRFPPRVPDGFERKLLQTVAGGAVRDVTSAFRAYRAKAVRRLMVRASGQAAHLDITAGVAADGYDVKEVDVTTSAPSTPLPPNLGLNQFLRGWLSPLGLLAALLVLLGAGVFFMSSFPPHEYLADSDVIYAAVCASDVSEGHHWLFYPTGRIGPHVCYTGSVFVALFGRTREALAAFSLVPVMFALTFIYLSLKVAVGRTAALVGTLTAALPPMQYVLFIEPAYGYAEVIACTAFTWWLGFQLLYRPWLQSTACSFAYGLVLGLNFWVSPQSLMLTLPLTLLLVARRAFRRISDYALATMGCAVGLWAFVWSVLNGVNPVAESFATRPVHSIDQLLSNLGYLFSNVLPLFFLNTEFPPRTPLQILVFVLLLVGLAAIVIVAARAVRTWSVKDFEPRIGLPAVFALGIIITTIVIFSASSAGNFRIWLVRYIAPIIFTLPLIAATLYAKARQTGYGLVVLFGVLIVIDANVASYRFPGHHERSLQTLALANDQRIYRWLQSHEVDAVVGEYWLVYKLNFGFGTGLRAIPTTYEFDLVHIRHRLNPEEPVRIALAHIHEPSLAAWASRAGLKGHIEPMDGGYFAFLVDGEVDPKQIDGIVAQSDEAKSPGT